MSRSILIICAGGIVSGKEVMALELANGLRAVGDKITFVASVWGNGEFRRRLAGDNLNAAVMRLGFISATLTWSAVRMTLHQMVYWPALLFSYGSLLRRAKPDRIVHTTWHHLLLLFPFLSAKRDIYWLHEVLPSTKQYRQVFRLLQKRLRYLVAVSEAAGDSLRTLGIPPEKIKVIHNGIADPVGDTECKTPSAKPFCVGVVGQVGEWKGHDDLLDAFKIVQEQHPSCELHIFGDGAAAYIAKLKERVARTGLKNVFWQGFVRDRRSIFGRISVCVVPSRFVEPFGLTAVEASLFAVPVVAARSGGLSEIVVDACTGFIVNQRAPAEIATCLLKLASDPSLLRSFGDAARLRALANFSSGRFVGAFDQVLSS